MQPIQAVLFDKDGTLFDFDATWSAVVARVISRLAGEEAVARALAEAGGFDWEARRFRPGSPIVAGAVAETGALWEPILAGPTAREIERRIVALSSEMTGPDTLVPAVPDLPGLLTRLAGRGLALGVATHDSAAGARAQLEAVGALKRFGFVAGYDSGHGLKPATGMLMAFAAAVEVAPQAVAVVGDSVHDLQMARAGGARALAVLTGPATADDLAPHADAVLPSIGALEDLLTSLSI